VYVKKVNNRANETETCRHQKKKKKDFAEKPPGGVDSVRMGGMNSLFRVFEFKESPFQ
jgi:hypothetical protein